MKKIIISILLFTPLIQLTAQTSVATSFDVDSIKVIFKPTVKNIVHIGVYFRGGVSNYPADKAGIEDLAVNGAVECGTEKYTSDAYKGNAALSGIEIHGNAAMDNASIKLNCILKYVNEGWNLLAEAVSRPVFNEDAFTRMKAKMITIRKASESNPDNRLETLALQTAFEGTPYAINPEGSEATLASITAQDAKDYYYKTLLNKSRIFIVVVGNISKEEIILKVRAAFAKVPVLGYQPAVLKGPVFKGNSVKVEERPLQTNYIMGIMNAPLYNSPEYVPFRLAFSELSGILYGMLRVRYNIAYSPDAGLRMGLLPYSYVCVSTTSPTTAVQVMVSSITGEEDNKIQKEWLDAIKSFYITRNYMKNETSASIANELALAETLGGWQMAEQLPGIINTTTRKEMFKAFKKYITGIQWIYLGDKSKADEAKDAFKLPVN